METHVALIGQNENPAPAEELRIALRRLGIEPLMCPPAEPRDILRWAMNLSPDEIFVCIFTDNEGRVTASLTTALHPAITPIVWSPASSDPVRFATILAETPALLCLAKNPAVPAQLTLNIVSRKPATAAAKRTSANIETVSRPDNPTPTQTADPADAEAYRKLETMMAAANKKFEKPAPVSVQQSALDFSIPLRELMTKGRKAANKASHPEALSIHYVKAVGEPFQSVFSENGLDREMIDNYLAGLDSAAEFSREPVVSDEVFEAVSHAKQRARDNGADCVQVIDFLHGLIRQPDTILSEILEDIELPPDELISSLDGLELEPESCSGSFFESSSLDQESFYQFDPAQVRNVEERLRDLPGFQKAAARVAEEKKKVSDYNSDTSRDPAATGAAPAVINRSSTVPPGKPESFTITGDFPSVDLVEHVADRILEGQIVAFQSDVMYALAADAGNPAAVERLRQTADFPPEKSLSVLIHSVSQLKHLTRANVDELEPLFDELWPGPLTLIFNSAGSIGRHISPGKTIAVRQPADNTSLAILSMLGRPLAVTSWDQTADQLAGSAAILINTDNPVRPIKTTVVDMTKKPWQILREGAVPGQAVLRFYNKLSQ